MSQYTEHKIWHLIPKMVVQDRLSPLKTTMSEIPVSLSPSRVTFTRK